MSLVGDYGSDSESDKEQQQQVGMDEDKQGSKRKLETRTDNTTAANNNNSNNNNNQAGSSTTASSNDIKKKPKVIVPLPEMFDDDPVTKSARSSSVAKYLKPEGAAPTPVQTTAPAGKTSNLTPPQLWKKKGNVSIEDTAAWNTERERKKKDEKK